MTSRQIPLDNHHIIEDLIRLGQNLDDDGNSVTVIHAFRPVSVR
jgi:hypothetical protein